MSERISNYISKSYLVSEADYAEAEGYWESFFKNISQEIGEGNSWFTFSEAFARLKNGETWHPVYQAAELGALSPILRKVRSNPNKLILLTVMDGRHLTTPSEDKKEGLIDASVGSGCWDTPYTTGEVDELRIWAMPTTDTLPMLRACILKWMKNETDREEMMQYIITHNLRG